MKGGEMAARLEASEVEFTSGSSLDDRGALSEERIVHHPSEERISPGSPIRNEPTPPIPSANGKGVNRMDGMLTAGSDSMQLLAAWGSWLRAQYSEATWEAYWGSVFRFMRKCPKPLTFVSEQDVAEWLESYPYRSSARVGGYEGLKSLFGWMEGHNYILINPVTGIRKPQQREREPEALTESEFRRVYGAAWAVAPHRAHALALLYYTGARLNEALNIEWDDVKSDHVLLRKTKNGAERKVALTPMLREALHGLSEAFPNETKIIPRSGQTVWKWCAEAGRETGIHVHPHLFRATAITDALNAGNSLQATAKWAGHKNMKVTHRYAASREEEVRKVAESLKIINLPESAVVSFGGLLGGILLDVLSGLDSFPTPW